MSPYPNFERADYDEPTPSYLTPEPDTAPATPTPALFTNALALGVIGAVLGAAIYAGFVILTHIQIGYLAILVAYLIAKAMTIGSRGEGGRYYQIAALILTYIAVSAANSTMIWWELHRTRHIDIPANLHNILLLARLGFESPFLEFKQSPVGALIGLFILFIGLRAAWRMTSGIPGAVRHPFAR
jgi:hypothetical protein